MVQALVNLLDNAAKYSPLDSPIELYAYGQAESVFIEVSDNGVGIPNEELGRIFDKFYRSKGVRHISGVGLGLSISKGIVEAHGGTIRAMNRETGGLTVVIEMPGPVMDEPG
jgi:two-component system sensor histidine kinase KdpD